MGLLSFFNDVTSDAIIPLFPAYLATMGLGAGFLGVMEGLADSLSNVLKLFSGWLADWSGKSKKIMVAGYSLSTFVRPFLAIPIPAVILMTRLFDRVGKGVRSAPRDHLITASVDKKLWGEAFGIQRAMDHAGAILGPLLATWLLTTYDLSYSKLFLIVCIPSIISLIFVPRGIREIVPVRTGKAGFFTSNHGANPDSRPDTPHRLAWKTLPAPLKKYLLIVFLAAFSTPSELFLILRIKDLGLQQALLPMAWLVMTVSSFVAAYLGGRVSDRWSRRRTIGLGWMLFTLVYIGFAFNTQPGFAWILMAGYGLQMGFIEPAERAYPSLVVPDTMRATALGWYYFIYGMGILPASLLFGFIWNHWGPRPAFLLNAGLTLATVFLLTLLPSDRKKPGADLTTGMEEIK